MDIHGLSGRLGLWIKWAGLAGVVLEIELWKMNLDELGCGWGWSVRQLGENT